MNGRRLFAAVGAKEEVVGAEEGYRACSVSSLLETLDRKGL